ncbi:hypothetical protein DSM03_1164 [Leeuwenhoekiella aestuarii]|uniref:MobB family relaxase n=1 Tax=Leeuwenhoekiella aestuarii TaxID=2249426 RepID=UPI000FFF19E8|nr:MobB family relaxase [Leeuwenhoekiella aestuarii]RXG11473.1 hypothetical protein DSM03_1164 [Leeuwenhoekiella aestuarii]
MYITISPQKQGGHYPKSSADFVSYLEKENAEEVLAYTEYFFNHDHDEIPATQVVQKIDGNTAKLKAKEPKFYSIIVSPSTYELQRLQNSSKELKAYTRELMKDYVAAFNREIHGRPLRIQDIMYFAKVEHQRTFKGTDVQVRENQPYAIKILALKNEIRRIKQGRSAGDLKSLIRRVAQLEQQAPHQQNGKRIVQGMPKAGNQSHIHIIVSRKDASNAVSLSPGSKYKASEVTINGKLVKRGFDRDAFYSKAEQTFDRLFQYQRNYAESYKARKEFVKNPNGYFAALLKLPANEKALAFKILSKAELPSIPGVSINKAQIALRVFKRLRRGAEVAIKSSSIGI